MGYFPVGFYRSRTAFTEPDSYCRKTSNPPPISASGAVCIFITSVSMHAVTLGVINVCVMNCVHSRVMKVLVY